MGFGKWYWKNVVSTEANKDILEAIGILCFWVVLFFLISTLMGFDDKNTFAFMVFGGVPWVLTILFVWLPYKAYKEEGKK